MDDKTYVSVLVPVLNEEESLLELHRRLMDTLNGIGTPYEIIYINDGSTDGTEVLLEKFHSDDKRIKVIEFNRNYGQHMALFGDSNLPEERLLLPLTPTCKILPRKYRDL
jgi:undecaprenyl-phosphate 4-deoxy-4-formamido-L-arabinose transferase